MEQKDHIQDELTQLGSPLPRLASPYQVGSGYFEQLPEWILKRLKAEQAVDSREETRLLASDWADQARTTPYRVPAGYFESLDLSFVWADENAVTELETLSPLLAGLKKENPYSLPDGFFEREDKPAVDIPAQQPARLVRFSSTRWFRLAAAAVVTGLVLTAALVVFRGNNTIDPNQKSYAWVEKNLKKVNTEDIDNLVELAGLDQSSASTVAVSPEIKSLMQDVSDREIQEFLNDTGVSDDDTDDELILN